MAITPPQPIPRPAIASWELDALGARLGARTVVLVYFGYDVQGKKVAEKRFEVTDNSPHTFAELVAACPAGINFKRQLEQFGVTLDAELSGSVD